MYHCLVTDDRAPGTFAGGEDCGPLLRRKKFRGAAGRQGRASGGDPRARGGGDGSVRTQSEGEPGAAASGSGGGPGRRHPSPEPGGAPTEHAQQGRGVVGGRHPGHQRRDARERLARLAAEATRGARRSFPRRCASRRANPRALARRRPDASGNRCDVDSFASSLSASRVRTTP